MSIESNAHSLDSSLFSEKPWDNLPETIEEGEEESQHFDLPEFETVEEVEVEEIVEELPSVESGELVPEQDFSLPGTYGYEDLDDEFGGEASPLGFRQLFDPKGRSDLTKLTETPPRMILPLVRARIIDAAYDEERIEKGQSLLSIFVEEFDKRMISKDRKGRLEAVELIRGLNKGDDKDDEEASL